MSQFRLLIIAIFILLVFSAKEVQAININPPNDKYWHFGVMTACSFIGSNFFNLYEGQWISRRSVLYSSVFCFSGGLAKEFLFDAKPDIKDIAANLAGIGAGALLTIPFNLGDKKVILKPLTEQKRLSVILIPPFDRKFNLSGLNFNDSIIEINAARGNINLLLTFSF